MKAVFYTQLFSDTSLSIGVKMVYSQLIFRAVICDQQSFDKMGEFDIDLAREFEGRWCGLDLVRLSKVADDLNLDAKTVYRAVEHLRANGLINYDNSIYIPDNMFFGFIELKPESKLKGWDLIVYSYIWGKTRRYKYVDTYRPALANFFGVSETHLSNIVTSLREKGRIKRECDWRNWHLSCK